MFEAPKRENKTRYASRLVSFALHSAGVFALVQRAPIFVKPSSVAWGQHGKSQAVVYVARNIASESAASKLTLPRKAKRKPPKPPRREPEALRAGSDNGSLDRGPAIGSEAMPALPLIFPDPVIYPWQLGGLHGDVIVEVTIDTLGNVTDTRILQSLKQEIDSKCVATLKSWRFKPATQDGVAIASRQDVHFHFPS